MEPAAIIDWLDGLNREEQDFVALYHECCLVTKWEQDWKNRAYENATDQ